jgi:hypothetical protein
MASVQANPDPLFILHLSNDIRQIGVFPANDIARTSHVLEDGDDAVGFFVCSVDACGNQGTAAFRGCVADC